MRVGLWIKRMNWGETMFCGAGTTDRGGSRQPATQSLHAQLALLSFGAYGGSNGVTATRI